MKFLILTLGCKVNLYESNYMSESLVNNGFLLADDVTSADIIIVNTCSVTNTSDKKSLKLVRRVRRENPEAILMVCGCSSQNNAQLYAKENINILIGNNEKSKVVSLINNYLKTKEKYQNFNYNRALAFEDMQITKFNHVRSYIKIQDGCNNFCSYCIIPFVRGDIRSKSFAKIICEAKALVQNGYQEIVLTGIHTGSYNDDGKDLCDVITSLSQIKGLKRIRLSSVEITELNDKFMELLKTNTVLCDHLHIPLQAGSDEILKVMNRKYDLSYYESVINKIRVIKPDIAITTDVIVGHNFETDKLFNETYAFCEKIKFAKIHVFPYSERKGTSSSRMAGKVDENVKKERCHKLISLSEKLEKDYYDKFKGEEKEILIETVKDGVSFGHTTNYLEVYLQEELEVNKIYKRII